MNKLAWLAIAALLPMAASAQNSTKSRPENVVTKLVRLQHADPHKVRELLATAGASASWDDTLHVLVISGTPSDVASLEQTAKELDAVSAQSAISNVEVTVYILGASSNSTDMEAIPKNLQSTVDQLKQLFPYSSFQLLETIFTRGRIGQTSSAQGTLQLFKGQTDTAPPNYEFHYRLDGITSATSQSVVHIGDFYFRTGFIVKTGNQMQSMPTGVHTNLDIPTGKKVVVGKAGAGGDHAIFLVVEAAVAK
jgi:hypothetical protein